MNPFMTLSRITKLKKESKELSNKIVEIKSSSNTPTNPTTPEEPLICGAWTWKVLIWMKDILIKVLQKQDHTFVSLLTTMKLYTQ